MAKRPDDSREPTMRDLLRELRRLRAEVRRLAEAVEAVELTQAWD
jgi:hypothetical protein